MDGPHPRRDRWVRVRLLGWSLMGVWQLLGIASEWRPLPLEDGPWRVAGKLVNVVGLALVAFGFERLANHTHAWS